jgi:hypothetical protein
MFPNISVVIISNCVGHKPLAVVPGIYSLRDIPVLFALHTAYVYRGWLADDG